MAFDPITAIANVANTVLDRVLPDKAAKDAAAAQLLSMQVAGEIASIAGQIDTNKAEATNTSLLVSGWRPFVGWTCGMGLAVQFVINPFATWIAALAHHPIVFPSLDMGTLMTLLVGMLGLGGLRTFEKTQGVAAK